MLNELGDILLPSSKIVLQDKSGQGKSLPFNKGQIIQCRVIRSIPPNHALLLFGKEQLMARTSVPLQEGQVALFKVHPSVY